MFVRCLALCCCLFYSEVGCSAENQGGKPYRIMMMLYRGSTDAEKGFMDYFKRRHIPVEFIVRDAQADKGRIAEFVREAKDLKPDLIYTFGTTVTTEVVGVLGEIDPTKHITDIPVVFDIVADPIGAKLVKSLKTSGRNLTGATHMVPLGAQMHALQAMRSTQTLGVIYNPNEKNSQLTVQELEGIAAGTTLSLQVVPLQLSGMVLPSVDAIMVAMRSLVAKKPQFIYLPSDSFLIKNARVVVQAAQRASIPVFAATEAPIRDAGALLGLVSTYSNVGELAAYKAEQILSKKMPVAHIPIESLNRFTYLINMKTAKQLAIYPPLSVLKFAELITPADMIDARE